jgi:hypothetical protein
MPPEDSDIIYVPQGYAGNWYMWRQGNPSTFAAVCPDGVVRCFKEGLIKETITHADKNQDRMYDTARMWLDRAEYVS